MTFLEKAMEINEKEAKNIDRVISILKSILAFYESKATPRRPLKSIRWALVVAIALCGKQIAKKPNIKETDEKKLYRCPCCDKVFVEAYDTVQRGFIPSYCNMCGQAIENMSVR